MELRYTVSSPKPDTTGFPAGSFAKPGPGLKAGWKLFHDYYHVIYRREKERGTAYSIVLVRYEPDIHWIHRRAGWLLQQRNAEPGRTDERLTHSEFEALADKRLRDTGHEDAAKRRELVTSIRMAATDRLVLLVGNTAKEIGFELALCKSLWQRSTASTAEKLACERRCML